MRKFIRSLCLAASAPAALLLVPMSAGAASDAVRVPPAVNTRPGADDAVRAYWTPERIANAKPKEMVVSGPLRAGKAHSKGEPQIFPGAAPTIAYDPSQATTLYDQSLQPQRVHQQLLGTGGIPYTTNRLYPVNDQVLRKIYPYATVGHLYFSEPSGDFQCSASVIRLSTIATAGHCVNDGNTHYYTNWLFIPAQNGSKAPYKSWTWAAADTTSAWYSGGGGVPNEQDDAVIVLNANKKGQKIGQLVGYLGYEYNTPLPLHITQLGYPCNLDNCSDPIATYSQDTAGPTNNFQWGTASFGGASGGPQLQDFGQPPSGVPTETLGGNILVSSTSYTYTDPSVQVDGGSILYAPGQNGEFTFGDDINYACSVGGC